MGAVGLQTYIWNNNFRSALLLMLFPLLLLGMVFVLTLGMIWSGWLPPPEAGEGAVGEAAHLMIGAAPLAIVVAGVWFVFAYVFNHSIIHFATPPPLCPPPGEPEFSNLLK